MMRRFFNLFVLALAGFLATCGLVRADATNAGPDFRQVYDLLRANLAGTSDARLNAAAVDGLLKELHGQATLVRGSAKTGSSQNDPLLVKSEILENNVAYLRVGRVGNGLAGKVGAAYRQLSADHKIAGVVLDLRFAGGDDYPAAAAAADLFLTKRIPLLKWDNTVEESHPAKEPISGPLMVLVNGETSGAAEALAAVLHEADSGMLIGNPTAGQATTSREFPLGNGERLRIAANPVRLGNGAAISRVLPDILVPVSVNDERAYLKNPYAMLEQDDTLSTTNTNDFLAFVDHTSEADLVREKIKAGDNAGVLAPLPAESKSSPKPVRVVQDPALARALDLIKGLAIVHESRL